MPGVTTAILVPVRRRVRAPRPVVVAVVAAAVAVAVLPVPGAVALVAGGVLAMVFGAPELAPRAASTCLKLSVVGIGAGVDLALVGRAGLDGLGMTAVTLVSVIVAAVLLGRWLGVGRDLALLIGVGTAICGGSAIAAIAPILRARPRDVGLALGVVFLLNAVALLLFPSIGAWIGLDDVAFGRWCALAIHDTSSVVGAAAERSETALEIATVTKLARALWIVPVGLVLARIAPAGGRAPKVPGFLLGFLAAAALTTFVPALAPLGEVVAAASRRGLAVALFLTGLGFSRDALLAAGARTLSLGIVLWAALAAATLAALR